MCHFGQEDSDNSEVAYSKKERVLAISRPKGKMSSFCNGMVEYLGAGVRGVGRATRLSGWTGRRNVGSVVQPLGGMVVTNHVREDRGVDFRKL